MDPNVFETANAGFAQAMYEEFLRDPASVDAGVAPAVRERRRRGGASAERDRAPRPAAESRPTPSPRHTGRRGRDAGGPSGRAGSRAVPIKGPAARLVQNMNESLTVPTATTFRELPVAQLESARKALNAAPQAGGAEREDLVHPPHRLRARPRHRSSTRSWGTPSPSRTASRCGYTPSGISLGLAVDVNRKDGSRGLVVPVIKGAETMDFAGIPRGLRRPGGEGAGQQADARRLRRRHDVAHQPGRSRHARLGAAAHGRPGQHHRGRRDRLPARVRHG